MQSSDRGPHSDGIALQDRSVQEPPLAGRGVAIEALYIHVPFCFHKCHYCDFYSIVDESAGSGVGPGCGDPGGTTRGGSTAEGSTSGGSTSGGFGPDPDAPPPARQARFAQRLVQELGLRAKQFDLRPGTVFVGGGTPTMLHPRLWGSVLSALSELGVLDRVREFTVEANPETVTPGLMRLLAEGGVNRVSMGAQSFQPELLRALERWHDPTHVATAVKTARDAGIGNINLDLIFAIPGQTLSGVDADLDAALALEPRHLSCYGLTYEPNTPLYSRLKGGLVARVDEELERAMYARVMDRLEEAGWEHYEVSNWARPGWRCQHNVSYWTNANWIGIGPSAASHVAGYRWKNAAHLGRYLDGPGEPPTIEHERLPAWEGVGEQLMLRLRLREGVPVGWVREHVPGDDPRHTAIEELLRLKMLELTGTHLRLTREGLFVGDSVITKLLG